MLVATIPIHSFGFRSWCGGVVVCDHVLGVWCHDESSSPLVLFHTPHFLPLEKHALGKPEGGVQEFCEKQMHHQH